MKKDDGRLWKRTQLFRTNSLTGQFGQLPAHLAAQGHTHAAQADPTVDGIRNGLNHGGLLGTDSHDSAPPTVDLHPLTRQYDLVEQFLQPLLYNLGFPQFRGFLRFEVQVPASTKENPIVYVPEVIIAPVKMEGSLDLEALDGLGDQYLSPCGFDVP